MHQTETYIRNLIQRGIVPGVSLLVARADRILLQKAFGARSLVPDHENADTDTIYDLASLTKPLVTAFLLARLIADGSIQPNGGVKQVLPGFPHPITILQLATHSSGYPDWHPLFLFDKPYREQLFSLPLRSKPGKKVRYSCPGYMLLKCVIEAVSGSDFHSLARELIFHPLGLRDTSLGGSPGKIQQTAPTEQGNRYEKALCASSFNAESARFPWRQEIIRGDTHDANSFYAGGSAGNAGLFSNTRELHRMCLEFFPATASLLSPEATSLFWKNLTPWKRSHRTLGFKLNSSVSTSGGRALSRRAIGHNGFTGTSLWMDPDSQLIAVILANRIHPHYRKLNFNRIRRRLHALLISDLDI